MVGLLDIGETTTLVEIRGQQLGISGIPLEGLVALLSRFPDLRKILDRRASEIDPEEMLKLAPEIVAAVIAAGIDEGEAADPKNEKLRAKREKVAASLGVGEQLTVISAIFKATFPQGVGPFVEGLAALSSGSPVSAPAPSDGTAPSTKPPKESKDSSESVESPKK